jgi:Zn ribbon nucleic-acid-binding protein
MATIIGEKVIFESVPCWNCNGNKTYESNILCPEWNRKVRGRLGGRCPHCGSTNRHRHQIIGHEPVECYYCSGTGQIMETNNSYLTDNVYEVFNYRVYREKDDVGSGSREVIDKAMIGNGIYGGSGKNIGGCTDYGASEQKTDEEVVESVRKNPRWSYLQIADECNILCREISIVVGKYGYTIRAIF